jgi:hypothetical protein
VAVVHTAEQPKSNAVTTSGNGDADGGAVVAQWLRISTDFGLTDADLTGILDTWHALPEPLQRALTDWPRLPDAIRRAVVALLDTAG